MNTDSPNQTTGFLSAFSPTIPIFVGFTQKTGDTRLDFRNTCIQVQDMKMFVQLFGGLPETGKVKVYLNPEGEIICARPAFALYDAVRLYFENGGKFCKVVTVGTFGDASEGLVERYRHGLEVAGFTDMNTLIALPDAALHTSAETREVMNLAMAHARDTGNRLLLLDLPVSPGASAKNAVEAFRDHISEELTSNTAVYGPWVRIPGQNSYNFNELAFVQVVDGEEIPALSGAGHGEAGPQQLSEAEISEGGLFAESLRMQEKFPEFRQALDWMSENGLEFPPVSLITGAFVHHDRTKGVWRAPAGMVLEGAMGLSEHLSDDAVRTFIESDAPVNPIQHFGGKGILVRTGLGLAGKKEESRHLYQKRMQISLRDELGYVLSRLVGAPNILSTWQQGANMVAELLHNLTTSGAFASPKDEESWMIQIGPGTTMTEEDIQAGRMVVHVQFAPVKPLEFILIEIEQNLLQVHAQS